MCFLQYDWIVCDRDVTFKSLLHELTVGFVCIWTILSHWTVDGRILRNLPNCTICFQFFVLAYSSNVRWQLFPAWTNRCAATPPLFFSFNTTPEASHGNLISRYRPEKASMMVGSPMCHFYVLWLYQTNIAASSVMTVSWNWAKQTSSSVYMISFELECLNRLLVM